MKQPDPRDRSVEEISGILDGGDEFVGAIARGLVRAMRTVGEQLTLGLDAARHCSSEASVTGKLDEQVDEPCVRGSAHEDLSVVDASGVDTDHPIGAKGRS